MDADERGAGMTVGYGAHGSSLRDLPRLRRQRRRRSSSWDRTGGNADRVTLRAGETTTLLDVAGAGTVTHIWMTVAVNRILPRGKKGQDPELLRRLVLRAWWDGEDDPSVEVPLGDFFGVGHGRTTNFVSAPLQMSPEDGRGFNCWFPMPFGDGARIEVTSECERDEVFLYFYVDHEELDTLDADVGRFHAQWRRENPCAGSTRRETNHSFQHRGTNLDGRENYTILEATGHGHYVGCVLSIRNRRRTRRWNWYGEGDDMIFIDGDEWPPTLHGTGTEDYVNTAWCPTQTHHAPYHGITLAGGRNWSGEIGLYRFHIEDPVVFERSIRVSIEHGHANKRSDDYSSVAYWYQSEPHAPFGLAPVADRVRDLSASHRAHR